MPNDLVTDSVESSNLNKSTLTLPDITSDVSVRDGLPLKWVGMEGIAVPFNLISNDDASLTFSAMADVHVSLDDGEAKGIHMSRLYLRLNEVLKTRVLSVDTLRFLLSDLIESQSGLSRNARLSLTFNLTQSKSALKSGLSGYQSYPIVIKAQYMNGKMQTELHVTIPYSSTCPCSSALAQQSLSDAFENEFISEEAGLDKSAVIAWLQSSKGVVATPHSQRSMAYIQLTLDDAYFPDLSALIEELESVIGTPVQTAVKRADEQAFAELNAQNLMFCEDAARRLKQALGTKAGITGFWFKVEHQESLHAHNAVAIDFG